MFRVLYRTPAWMTAFAAFLVLIVVGTACEIAMHRFAHDREPAPKVYSLPIVNGPISIPPGESRNVRVHLFQQPDGSVVGYAEQVAPADEGCVPDVERKDAETP